MTDFGRLLQTLAAADIRCAIIGGVAAVAHGAGRMTQDLDIVYDRSPDNLKLLANALRPLHPYLRLLPSWRLFSKSETRVPDRSAIDRASSYNPLGCTKLCAVMTRRGATGRAAGIPTTGLAVLLVAGWVGAGFGAGVITALLRTPTRAG